MKTGLVLGIVKVALLRANVNLTRRRKAMSRASKLMEERARDIDKTRRLLKQFLYALYKSEGFGERRLIRVLAEWAEVYKFVNDPKNNANDEMLMIDRVLDTMIPRTVMSAVGYEKLLDTRGREIK